MRAAFGDTGDETGKASPCFRRHCIAFDDDTPSFQPVETLACGAGIRIGQRADDAGGLGSNQAVGTGRPTRAFMRTRFQADKDCRTCRSASGLLQRHCLGMRAATGLCPATSDDDAVLDDNAADRGIITRPPLAAFGKRNRGGKPALVFARNFGFGGYFDAPTRAAISASALARRSASSFCASASSVSTSMPTALPKAL
jgi:hypothetical protein